MDRNAYLVTYHTGEQEYIEAHKYVMTSFHVVFVGDDFEPLTLIAQEHIARLDTMQMDVDTTIENLLAPR
jgi:hypothetical protein